MINVRGPVVCLGVHILDILGRPVSFIPPGQQSVLIDEIRATAAGTAAGTSVDLAKLGTPVTNIGALGDDLLGDIVVTLLEQYGVSTHLLHRFAGWSTSATILPIRPNGERPALHAAGANGALTVEHLEEQHHEAIRGAPALHLGGLDAMTSIEPGAFAEVITECISPETLVMMDVLRNGDRSSLRELEPVLRLTNWFCPNEEQLLGLTGADDVHDAVKVVLSLGVDGVAVTRGENGVLVVTDGVNAHVPALPVEVVDTTGCGDAFDAGFLTGLLAGLTPVQAAWVGSACGGLVATGLGSDAGIVDALQVSNLLEVIASDEARAAAVRVSEWSGPIDAQRKGMSNESQ